jgi:pimeloyl-ACP methyl ester carboxylesterase
MMSTNETDVRTVALPNGPAAYVDVGTGPPIVCVHGLPGSSRDFRWLSEHLAGRARLIAMDLPGFGRTPVATAPDASPEGRAAFVLAFIDALGLERPMIVGHSMGGVVAVAAVARRLKGFRALGLLSSPGLRPHATYRRLPRRALHFAISGPWTPLLVPVVRRAFAAAGFRGYPDAALLRTLACLRHTSLEDHAERLRSLTLPTFTAWCQDDAIIEPTILAELSDALPPGPRLVWPTGGHVPQKTHAAEVVEAIVTLARPPYTRQPHNCAFASVRCWPRTSTHRSRRPAHRCSESSRAPATAITPPGRCGVPRGIGPRSAERRARTPCIRTVPAPDLI